MHVKAPEGVSTCRSKNAKAVWVEKVFDYLKACNSLKGKISKMKVIEDFESRPHKADTFGVERGKERQEWSEERMPKVLPGYSGGRLPGRSTEEKCREDGEEDEGSEERRVRNEIIKEVTKGFRRRMRARPHAKGIVERRRIEGSALSLDAMQRVPQLVVTERMSQCERVKCPTEKKNVPGWSIEEMKEKPNIAVEEDIEEMRK